MDKIDIKGKMTEKKLIANLNGIAAKYGYGKGLEPFTDDEWNSLFQAKEIINDYARLTAENDKLQKRLDNAVELKAKEGDTLFMPWKYDGNVGIATLRIIGINFRKGEFAYITDLESDSAYYLAKYKYGIFRNKDFDSIVYTDRTAVLC